MTTAALPTALPAFRNPKPNKAVWVLISIVAHLALLALGWALTPKSLPNLRSDPVNAIYVDIEPVVLPRAVPARAQPMPASTDDSRMSSASAPGQPVPRIARHIVEGRPSTPLASEGTASATPEGAWTYVPETTGNAVARSVRTSAIGCAYLERLSEGEREICRERATERAVRKLEEGQRITGSGDARRDARFEAEGRQRQSQYNQRRRPISNSEIGNTGPTDTPGSNFGLPPAGRHLDPSLQPDAVGPIQTRRRDGPAEERIQRTPH